MDWGGEERERELAADERMGPRADMVPAADAKNSQLAMDE
jgi:hypothetical protein